MKTKSYPFNCLPQSCVSINMELYLPHRLFSLWFMHLNKNALEKNTQQKRSDKALESNKALSVMHACLPFVSFAGPHSILFQAQKACFAALSSLLWRQLLSSKNLISLGFKTHFPQWDDKILQPLQLMKSPQMLLDIVKNLCVPSLLKICPFGRASFHYGKMKRSKAHQQVLFRCGDIWYG